LPETQDFFLGLMVLSLKSDTHDLIQVVTSQVQHISELRLKLAENKQNINQDLSLQENNQHYKL